MIATPQSCNMHPISSGEEKQFSSFVGEGGSPERNSAEQTPATWIHFADVSRHYGSIRVGLGYGILYCQYTYKFTQTYVCTVATSEQKDQNDSSNERKSSITSFMEPIKPQNCKNFFLTQRVMKWETCFLILPVIKIFKHN